MLSEGWECYFRDPIVQNLPREHAPGPPQQLAPSALVIAPGPPHPPAPSALVFAPPPPPPANKSNLATAPDSTEDWFSFQIKTVKHLGCFLVGGRPFLT